MRSYRLHIPVRAFGLAFVISIAAVGTAFATAPAISSFSPATGTIGTTVTIAGSGFTGATNVAFNGAAATRFTVVSATKITAVAPTTVSTGALTVTTSGGSGKSATNFTVTPGVQLSPAAGPPQSKLTVSAAGFHNYAAVDVYLDTVDTALAASNNRGLVSAQIQVPASTQPGDHWITLIERGTSLTVQQPYTVRTNWVMDGFVPQGRGFNPYENTITTSNASQLSETWSKNISAYGNASPFIVVNDQIFVVDINGGVHAFSNTGKLLWHAKVAESLPAVSPASYGGFIYVGDATGNVYAFKAACRTDGGVCAPVWTKSVGTKVTSGLTIFNGSVYAPSADGSIHVLGPATGAQGTPIYGEDTTHGPVTTPITFTVDGTFYYGAGSYLQYRTSFGSTGFSGQSSTISPVIVSDGIAFFSVYGGDLIEFGGASWSAALPGGGCGVAPVIANNIIYAGGCSGLAAFEVGTGNPIWSTSSAAISGLSAAGGVVYACAGGTMIAYNAAYGSRLWSSGSCAGGQMKVVDGTLYRANNNVVTYNLPGGAPNLKTAARPVPRALKPNYGLLKQYYRPSAAQE